MHRFRATILFLFIAVWISCTGTAKIERVETSQYRLGKGEYAAIDSSLFKIIDPYRQNIESQMDEVLAYSEQVMEKGTPEGLLGNFVADLCYEEILESGASVDICLLNNGGLRSALPAGELTRGKIYELMPFENELLILEISGKNFKELCDYVAYRGSPVANLRMSVVNRRAQSIEVGGQAFTEDRNYKVATSDYLANKGDILFLNNPISVHTTGLKVRDAIIQHLQELHADGKTVEVHLDNRIKIEDE